MSRCGCAGSSCSCVIQGSGGVSVLGSGTIASPYVISTDLNLAVIDTATVQMALSGSGSPADPYLLAATAGVSLDELEDVNASNMTTGYVLARQADGSFALVPPSTAAVGAITAGNGITGDGSSGSPLAVKLAPSSGLVLDGTGLKVASAGGWSAYTPQLHSTSTTGAQTLDASSWLEGRYKQDGKTVHFVINAYFSANFVPPAGHFSISLPVPSRPNWRQPALAQGLFTDDGSDPVAAGQRADRHGIGDIEGDGFITRIRFDRGGYNARVGSLYPRWRAYFVRMFFNGSYEAA